MILDAGKRDSLATEYVFVDTCVFISEKFNSNAYRTLIRLGSEGAVSLILTDITLKEIQRNIFKEVEIATAALQKKSGEIAILRNISGFNQWLDAFSPNHSSKLGEDLWQRVSQELTAAKVRVVSATDVPAWPIFESYFQVKPPFGQGKKSKEFPDAFVIAALERWCENVGEKIYIVSSDSDMLNAAEASTHLFWLRSLADFVDLALRRNEEVKRAVEYLEQHTEAIEAAIREEIDGDTIGLEDQDGDGEATVERMSYVSIDEVVRRDGDTLVLLCTAEVELSIDARYAEPGMTMYSSEDQREYVFGYIDKTLQRTVRVDAEVTIRWVDESSYSVKGVVIDEREPIYVYVDGDDDRKFRPDGRSRS